MSAVAVRRRKTWLSTRSGLPAASGPTRRWWAGKLGDGGAPRPPSAAIAPATPPPSQGRTAGTRKTTRRGDIWAVITVEDLEASIEVLLFPRAYEMTSTVLATDTVVKINGSVKVEDDVVSLNAS